MGTSTHSSIQLIQVIVIWEQTPMLLNSDHNNNCNNLWVNNNNNHQTHHSPFSREPRLSRWQFNNSQESQDLPSDSHSNLHQAHSDNLSNQQLHHHSTIFKEISTSTDLIRALISSFHRKSFNFKCREIFEKYDLFKLYAPDIRHPNLGEYTLKCQLNVVVLSHGNYAYNYHCHTHSRN